MVMVTVVAVTVVMVVMVTIVDVAIVMMAVVAVMVVPRQAISPTALSSHGRTAAVSNRRVASLGHVVRVRSATGGQLPRANGGGWSRRRGGV